MRKFSFFLLAVLCGCGLALISQWPAHGQTELFKYSSYEVVTAHRGEVRALAFDDQGKLLASAGKDGGIMIRDVAGKQVVKQLPGHSKPVNALAFRRDGRYLASGSDDKTVRLWNLQTGEARVLEQGNKVTAVAFNPSGDMLAVGDDNKQVTLWSVETGRNLGSHSEHKEGIKHLFFAKDESLYSVGKDRRMIEWDVKGKRVLRSWSESEQSINSATAAGDWLMLGVESLFAPKGITRTEGTRATEAVSKNFVKVYSLATGGLQKDFDFGTSSVMGLSISADYSHLAAIRRNSTKSSVIVYDIKRGEQVAIIEPLSKDKMTALSFSPNGQWLVSGNDTGALNVWRIEGISQPPPLAQQDLRGRKNVFTTSREPLLAFKQMTSIAILDLDAIGVEPSLAKGISEQLRARVAGAPSVRLIERERIEKVLNEVKFQQSGNTDPVAAARIGKILNISKTSFGSLSRLGKNLIVTVQLVDVQTAAIDGIRQIVCNNCVDEDLLETVAALQPALVARDQQFQTADIGNGNVVSSPSIKLGDPAEGDQVTQKEIMLRGLVSDLNGLTSVKITLSGQKRDLTVTSTIVSEPKEFSFKEPQKSFSLNHPISLLPGSNVITITAQNSNGLTEQLKRAVYLETPETAVGNRPIGKKWAFIVGISNYKDSRVPKLDFAHRDAQDLAAFLQTESGGSYQPENMVVLTDERASWEDIRAKLREFARKPERDDLVLVFLAAHGANDPDQPGMVYLVANNTQPDKLSSTGLSVGEVELALRENLRAQRVVFLADTCHSGAFSSIGTRDLMVSNGDTVNLAFNEAIRRSKPGAFVFAAAQGNELSRESKQWGDGHGVFTWYLLEALKGKADADGDGVVRADEVFAYVYKNVTQDTNEKQHPTNLSSKYDPKLPLAINRNQNTNKAAPRRIN